MLRFRRPALTLVPCLVGLLVVPEVFAEPLPNAGSSTADRAPSPPADDATASPPADDAPSPSPPADDALADASAPTDAGDAATPSRDVEPPRAAPTDAPVEVTVAGHRNDPVRLQRSAEAVNVIGTQTEKRETVDLGEVLARSQGVAVRRDGGLGSGARVSLNGLQDDQVRFFLDGVPLDRAGYPFGVANVPVNLVERVEVYRGVVPIRFGADALGGAVNLVSHTRYDTHLGASYQVGSFGTNRAAVDARYLHDRTGFVLAATGFVDAARNDYPVDVDATDARGRVFRATVRRFHDRYAAGGASLEAGFVDRPWARRLSFKGFASTFDKQLQNNVVMTTPYGEVTYGESVYGATARYEHALRSNLDLEIVGNYAHHATRFVDDGVWVYDWFGRRVREKRVAGEVDDRPFDRTIWLDSGFGRALLAWTVEPKHVVRVSTTATYSSRSGTERLLANTGVPDPFALTSTLLSVVSGAEYQIDAFDDHLENILFVKDYAYRATAQELDLGATQDLNHGDHAFGGGDAIRYRFGRSVYLKASYEYATRLPRTDEIFGNGILVAPNLAIDPEVSHNGNLGPRVELRKTAIGNVTIDVNAFVRQSQKLIVLLGTEKFQRYDNVYAARGLGVENAVAWTSPKRTASLSGTLTYQDVRNISSEGPFGDFDGDRIPNRPWLFGSLGGRLRFPDLLVAGDAVEPFYYGRYVHAFYRGWESQGLRAYKQVVDAQLTHDVGVSWTVSRNVGRVTSTVEIDNATNAKVYDFYGVQRPGRSLFVKMTVDL